MGLTNTAYTLSTGAATALNGVSAQILELYIVPTTVIYLGPSTTASSSGVTIALSTAGILPNNPAFRVPAGSILYAGPASSSAITVTVMARSL